MFRNAIEANNDVVSDSEFANNLNNEFLTDYIYCYTPKGDVLELPKGATPVDFAYRIHSGVGDRTIGALVNNQIVGRDRLELSCTAFNGFTLQSITEERNKLTISSIFYIFFLTNTLWL